MNRDIAPEQLSALINDKRPKRLFADIDWPSGRVRVHTGLGERVFMGDTYIGVGEFAGIGNLTESASDSPVQLALTLKVLDPALVALVFNESPELRDVAIHMAVLDDNNVIEHEIPYIFDGTVAKYNVKRGDTTKQIPYIVKLTCSDWLERWSMPPQNSRTTNQAQQALHPGDRIFDLTEIIAGSPLSALPTKQMAGGGGGGGGGGGRYHHDRR